jgi:hypothetical protein
MLRKSQILGTPNQVSSRVRVHTRIVPFVTLLFLLPIAAQAQSGSPFDTGFTNLQTLFTGTIAKSGFTDRNRDRRIRLCARRAWC